MPTDPYDDILKKFGELSQAERQQLLEKLHAASTKGNGITPSRTLFDAFNDDGMIGSITDAPSDLSTNPKHLEGFGDDG